MRPHVSIVLPFIPANLDEMQSVTDLVALARRNLHAIAVSFHQCVERGDALFYVLDMGGTELVTLHDLIHGGSTVPLQGTAAYEPLVWLGRVADPGQRPSAVAEANRIGRSLGVIDALSLLRIEPDETTKLVQDFPFGVGRVDYYDRPSG
jgi:hypothetical protein